MAPKTKSGSNAKTKAGKKTGASPAAIAATQSRNGSSGAMEQPAQQRVVIEGVRPEVDGGRYSAKAVVGENAVIEADIYSDNHEEIAADVLCRRADKSIWASVPMEALVNDRWRATIPCTQVGTYVFTIVARVDHFARWQQGLGKKAEAGQDVQVDLMEGANLIGDALARTRESEAAPLRKAAATLMGRSALAKRVAAALDPTLGATMRNLADNRQATTYGKELRIQVDPKLAEFSAWYEMFPRSSSPDAGRAGTFRDIERRLDYVATMGFDVLYLPPIHPIGSSHRKGPNNAEVAAAGDAGSPWAIGSELGGHKAINPDLGTPEDFRRLVKNAQAKGINVALDVAFQCSPDHPYVKEHPEWFRHRPDGSVQYAENPPKKYQDIYPFDFETSDREGLWEELKSIFLYWMGQGVLVFRIDNPHTKPFAFWEWCIEEIRKVDPTVILLAEAFTTPKIMYHLAKLGFTQSYTYFAWRRNKWELADYFTEVSQPPVADFFRPNAWPNTPDILTEQMQMGGRPAFVSRLVLAATLSSNYGIYGPPYELMERTAREPGSEEYLDSEKYEVRHWNIERPDSLRDLVALVNTARRENPALQTNRGLRFHSIENDHLIAYSKETEDRSNIVVCVVNLDPKDTQAGMVSLPITDWGIAADEPYQVHDLLSDARYTWQGVRNYVELKPQVMPAHVFRLRRRSGTSGRGFE